MLIYCYQEDMQKEYDIQKMYNDIDSMIDMQDSMKRFVQLIYKIFGPLLCKYQGICRSSQYFFTFEKNE